MVNPSDAYSDIGDFGAGEAGWWFGKPEADHPGLQQKLSELGVEVIHRGTTPPEQSEYAPEADAAYYDETSEVLHLGDGTSWNAQATWGENPTFSSAETVQQDITGGLVVAHGANGFQKSYLISDYAGIGEAVNTAFSDTPPGGGTVKVTPGEYSDSDFNTGIHLPTDNTESNNQVYWGLDMHGVAITLSSWDGSTMIDRKTANTYSRGVKYSVTGPSIDARNVPAADLGIGAELVSLQQSDVKFTLRGEFDIGLHTRSQAGSGHYNTYTPFLQDCDIQVKIGDVSDSLGPDRSVYKIQGDNVGDTGCLVEQGSWNEIYCNAEGARSDATLPVRGVHIPKNPLNGNNTVKIVERIDNVAGRIPLDIQNPSTQIDLVGRGIGNTFKKCRFGLPPDNIQFSGWTKNVFDGTTDFSALFNTSVAANGSLDNNNYGALQLTTGTADGETTYLQVPTVRGAPGQANTFFLDCGALDNLNARVRFGWHSPNDSQNFALFEANTTENTNWQVKAKLSGTDQTGIQSSQAFDQGNNSLIVCSTEDEDGSQAQFWYVNDILIGETNYDLNGQFNPTQQGIRMEVQTVGTAGSNRSLAINRFQYGQVDDY